MGGYHNINKYGHNRGYTQHSIEYSELFIIKIIFFMAGARDDN